LREETQKKVIALQEEKQKEERTVQRLLQKNMNIEFIREVTGFTKERIEEIQKKIGE